MDGVIEFVGAEKAGLTRGSGFRWLAIGVCGWFAFGDC